MGSPAGKRRHPTTPPWIHVAAVLVVAGALCLQPAAGLSLRRGLSAALQPSTGGATIPAAAAARFSSASGSATAGAGASAATAAAAAAAAEIQANLKADAAVAAKAAAEVTVESKGTAAQQAEAESAVAALADASQTAGATTSLSVDTGVDATGPQRTLRTLKANQRKYIARIKSMKAQLRLYIKQIRDFTRQRSSLSRTLAAKTKANQDVTSKRDTIASKVKGLMTKKGQLEGTISGLASAGETVKNKLGAEIQTLGNKKSTLTSGNSNLQSKLEQLKTKVTAASSALASAQKKRDLAVSALNKLKDEKAALESQLADLEATMGAKVEALKRETEDLRKQHAATTAEISESNKKLLDMQDQVRQAQHKHNSVSQAKATVDKEVASIKTQMDELRREETEMRGKLDAAAKSFQAKKTALTRQITELKAQKAADRDKAATMKRKADKARADLKSTQDELDELVKTSTAHRRELETAAQELQVELAKLNAESDSAKRRLERLDTELGEERSRLAASLRGASAAEQTHEDMRKHLSELTIRRQKLLGQVAQLKHRVSRITAAHHKVADLDQDLAEKLSAKQENIAAATSQVHVVHTVTATAPGAAQPAQGSAAAPITVNVVRNNPSSGAQTPDEVLKAGAPAV